MPYFLGCTSNIGFSTGIAENEAIFIAVFLKPKIKVISSTVDVYCHTKLVFAISGNSNPLFSLFNSFFI